MLSELSAAGFRIARLVRKELWQLYRDRFFLALLFVLPLVLLFLIVRSAGGERRAPDRLAIIDHDRSASSRRLIEALENTHALRVTRNLTRLADGDQALFEGHVHGLVVIPRGFERDLLTADATPEILVVVDGSNTLMAGQLLTAAEGAIAQQMAFVGGSGEATAVLDVRSTQFFEVTAVQSRLAPQLGFLLFQVVLMVAGLSIVRESETGTLEQLLVTPLTKFELILGKMLPPLLVGIVNFGLLLTAARYFWDLPVRGSVALLFGIALLFILSESAWGLFLSSRVTRQQQATQLIFVQILFDMAFCGYVVPVANLPSFLSWISELLPLRHYLACVRSILLRGGDASAIWGHIAALVVLNIAFWTLSITSLRQRLS
jgi:ABC-2 type transport system permease protein